MRHNIWIFIAVFLVATVLRFWQLGNIPVSMSDDETRLVYNAYSIWNTAKDINSHLLPLAFPVDGYAFNPIPIYITSPFVGLFGLSMFVSRFPFAMAGAATVILLYAIAYVLLKNHAIAIFSSLALSFSVWHLQISRFAYEGGFALFFFTLGVLIFLLIKKRNMGITIAAMSIFFIGFHSYSGTKLIFIPVITALVWYKFRELKYKQLIVVVFFVLLSFVSFFFLTKTQNAAQYGSGQFFFQDIKVASEAVELERRSSQAPEILKRLYHNKLTYWSKIFIDHYSYAFSPQYLFTSQEGSGIFSLWFRGQMYALEAPLVFLGLFYLFQKKRRELMLLMLLLVIAPLPSGLGPEPITYTIRSSFMLPWLMVIVGSGFYAISYFIKSRNIKIIIYLMVGAFYLYLIGGYLNQYYNEWKIYGAKYYSKADQDLALFINREKNNKDQIVVDGISSVGFLHYAFYNKISPSIVLKIYKNNPIRFENIVFNNTCIDLRISNPRNKIPKKSYYIVSADCPSTRVGSNYTINPNRIIKSLEGLGEWLVFEK